MKAARGDVEWNQQLQQELQRDRRVDAHVLRDFEDQPDVLFDDVEQADLFLQGPAPEFVADRQGCLVA